jgi:hypothetical protein
MLPKFNNSNYINITFSMKNLFKCFSNLFLVSNNDGRFFWPLIHGYLHCQMKLFVN